MGRRCADARPRGGARGPCRPGLDRELAPHVVGALGLRAARGAPQDQLAVGERELEGQVGRAAGELVHLGDAVEPGRVLDVRAQPGRHGRGVEGVLGAQGAADFIDRYVHALIPVLDGYRRENKHYATIAVGCTGGKHRSVAVTEEIAQRLAQLPGVQVASQHRDLGRE